ncbi:hypothetical protein [Streptomyces galbus]|uniref:Uncharacterized protein n=1 Tax=Streptomyces galbus TaxID=33898 RepID=A0A4U5WYG4_STRGB|nr:hypothetical protein [Streptomyces galbus]TKT07350.1 hypothetical protein E4U92_21695 [Streptomyces galbus]GHD36623.1 hypothetical protein GCM10010335_32910 [Streptomyces galbus]
MRSPALTAALADIDTVFDGFASPTETGCGRCRLPEETAHLRSPYTRDGTGLEDVLDGVRRVGRPHHVRPPRRHPRLDGVGLFDRPAPPVGPGQPVEPLRGVLSIRIPHAEDELPAALRSWVAAHAPVRLRALGEPDLAERAGLLALSYDDRWAHPYWRTASATS